MIKRKSFYVHRAYFQTPTAASIFLHMLDSRNTRFVSEQVPGGYRVSYGV